CPDIRPGCMFHLASPVDSADGPNSNFREESRHASQVIYARFRFIPHSIPNGEQRLMIERLNHTVVYVLDQEESLKFYRDKLGFEVRTDATMDNGFRWLTVGLKTQPDLEFVLMKIEVGPMCDAERAAMLKRLVAEGAFCVGVFETSDCRATY